MRVIHMLLKILLTIAIGLASVVCSASNRSDSNWVVGYWHMTADEDNGAIGGVIDLWS